MLVLTPVIRVVAVVFGALVFGTGVAAVFVTENGTGAAALLAIGAAHGLRLAELMVPNLTSTEAAQLKVITERARRRFP